MPFHLSGNTQAKADNAKLMAKDDDDCFYYYKK